MQDTFYHCHQLVKAQKVGNILKNLTTFEGLARFNVFYVDQQVLVQNLKIFW